MTEVAPSTTQAETHQGTPGTPPPADPVETGMQAEDQPELGDDSRPLEPRKTRKRANRYRLFGDGDGDYCIYQAIGKGHKTYPEGALVPIPNIPRFESGAKAKQWIRTESGDLLIGMQVMVFKGLDLLQIATASLPRLVISEKPKVQVTGPKVESEDG